jgi:hypothetical protein
MIIDITATVDVPDVTDAAAAVEKLWDWGTPKQRLMAKRIIAKLAALKIKKLNS